MGRVYQMFFGAYDYGVQLDLFQFTAAAGIPVAVHGFGMFPYTEIGDGNDQIISLSLLRGSSGTTSGSGGFVPGPGLPPYQPSDSAASFAFLSRNTTLMTGGTITTLRAWVWDFRVPFYKYFTPETRPIIAGSERMVLRMGSAPASVLQQVGYVIAEELA